MLSNDDREWLEEKFTRVHARMDNIEAKVERKGSDIHQLEVDFAQPCADVVAHEEKYHNPAKTWGIISAMIGGLTGVIELGKWIFKRGGP